MITDEQYALWLASPSTQRCFLVEMKYWDGTSEQTMYLSTAGYVSYPTDSPANTAYLDVVLSIPQFDSSLSVPSQGNFSITATAQRGDLKIANPSGEYDHWLNYAFDGRKIDLYLGDIKWARADYRLVINAYTESLEANGPKEFTVRLRGIEHLLDVEISQNLVAAGTDKDKPLPLCFGDCFNVQPVLIDAALHKYQVHDGAINSLAVKDNGVTVAFTPTLSAGTFTLSAQPAGNITCDVTGAKPTTYLGKVSEIVKHILLTRTTLTSAQLDLDSFTAHATACPQTVGIYIREGARVIEVMNELLASVGSFYTRSASGKIRIVRFDAPTNSPVLTITTDSILVGEFEVKQEFKPIYRLKLGYRRNFFPSDSLAGSVGETDRERLKAEYRYVSVADLAVQTAHKLAVSPDDYVTGLTVESEALTEANRLLNLHKVKRRIYELRATLDATSLQLGDTVQIIYPRYGFENGLNAVVVGLTLKPDNRTVNLEVWR